MRSVFVIDIFSSGMIQENEIKYVSYHSAVDNRSHKFVDIKRRKSKRPKRAKSPMTKISLVFKYAESGLLDTFF